MNARSWGKALPGPVAIVQAVLQPVMQPRGPAMPELNCLWPHKVASPVIWPGNLFGLVRILLPMADHGCQHSEPLQSSLLVHNYSQ